MSNCDLDGTSGSQSGGYQKHTFDLSNREDLVDACTIFRDASVQVTKLTIDGIPISFDAENLPPGGIMELEVKSHASCFSDALCFGSLVQRATSQWRAGKVDINRTDGALLLEKSSPELSGVLSTLVALFNAMENFFTDRCSTGDPSSTVKRARANMETIFSRVPEFYTNMPKAHRIIQLAKQEATGMLDSKMARHCSSHDSGEPSEDGASPTRGDTSGSERRKKDIMRPKSADRRRGRIGRYQRPTTSEESRSSLDLSRGGSEQGSEDCVIVTGSYDLPDERLDQMNQIAERLSAAGEHDECIKIRVQYLALIQLNHGEKSLETIKAMLRLAEAYLDAGRSDAALLHATAAYKLNSVLTHQEAKEFHARVLHFLSRVHASSCPLKKSNMIEAFVCIQKALRLNEAIKGTVHDSNCEFLMTAAKMHESEGRAQESINCITRALNIKEKLHGEHHFDCAPLDAALARMYDRVGKDEDAYSLYMKAHEIFIATKGALSVESADTARAIARVHKSSGDCREAAEWLHKACEGFDSALGTTHKRSMAAWKEYGVVLVESRSFRQAIEIFKVVLGREADVLGTKSSQYVDTLKLLGSSYLYNCEFELALGFYQKHVKSLKKRFGENAKRVKDVKKLIKELLVRIAQDQKAPEEPKVPPKSPKSTGKKGKNLSIEDALALCL